MISPIPPAFPLILGALLIPFISGRAKKIFMLALPLVSFANLVSIPTGINFQVDFLGMQLILGQVDKLSLIFGYIFHIILFITVIYSLHLDDDMQHMASQIYAGAALGATFAGDMFTLFLFWETLTVSATLLIWARRTKRSQGAGIRYFLVHVAGGLCLLAGIMLRAHETGSIAFDGIIGLNGSLYSYLIFIGFGVNCAWPFLHNWLSDAYPEATITGTIALSAFTTKTAVYALARAYPGTDALIWIGAAMAGFPIFFAVIENDLRRVLAYSLINQVGFMVVGIGVGTAVAVNGAVCHAFNDILFKGLLFMSMGAVMYRTGRINASALGGLYKSMPLTCIFCMVGAASISAFPLFSGFVSKSMVMEAAAHENLRIVWFVLLFASAGVFHHAGIKIPFFAFFSHDQGIRCKEAPLNMLIAMGIAAFLCIFIGSYPYLLYDLLPNPVEYEPYTTSHVISQTQILFFSALAFALLLLSGIYPAEMRSTNLDFDWTYRKGAALVYRGLDKGFNGLINLSSLVFVTGVTGAVNRFLIKGPQRVAGWLATPFLALSRDPNLTLKQKRQKLHAALSAGASPIGVTAAAATLTAFGVILYTLLR